MTTKTLNALELSMPNDGYFDLYYKGESLGYGKNLLDTLAIASNKGFTHIKLDYALRNTRVRSVKALQDQLIKV